MLHAICHETKSRFELLFCSMNYSIISREKHSAIRECLNPLQKKTQKNMTISILTLTPTHTQKLQSSPFFFYTVTHIHTHTHTHTHTLTHIYTRAHTYTQAHTHIHKLSANLGSPEQTICNEII